jgi:hypothetical protein
MVKSINRTQPLGTLKQGGQSRDYMPGMDNIESNQKRRRGGTRGE